MMCRLLCVIAAGILVSAPSRAQTSAPQLAAATFLGNGNMRQALAVTVAGGTAYVAGYSSENGNDALLAGFPGGFANNAAPSWTTLWPAAAGSDIFYGVAVATEGVFAVGDSYSRTTDSSGGKEGKGITVKFPLTGPNAAGTGEDWAVQTPAVPGAFIYGGGEGLSAVATASESGSTFIYATGSSQQNGANGGRFYLSKLTTAGAIVWTRNDGASMVNNAYSRGAGICVLNGNVYTVGRNDDEGVSKGYLRKYDTTGSSAWFRASSPSQATELFGVAAVSGAVIAVGTTSVAGNGSEFFLQKWDESGTSQWSRTHGGTGEEALYGITVINGRVFVVGSASGTTLGSQAAAGGKDVAILEINPANGDVLSTTLYGGTAEDVAAGAATDGTSLFVAGRSASFGGAGTNVMLLRFTVPAGGGGSAPTIASFSPTSIASGLPVTITGTNFTDASSVQFGGTPATFTVDSATQITATVPFGLPTSAPISVTTPGGTATSSTNYTITFAPIITSFSPASGAAGRVITISGANFNFGQPAVRFNGVASTNVGVIGAADGTSVIKAVVPLGATSGTITVNTFNGSMESSSSFTVAGGTAPANNAFASAQAITADSGAINASNANATRESGEPHHAGDNGGSFGGASVWYRFVAPNTARYLFDPTGSEIRTMIGVYTGSAVNALSVVALAGTPHRFGGNYNGAVEFTANAGSAYYIAVDGGGGMSGDFMLRWSQIAAPTIASFSPTSAFAGQMITIAGTGFTPTARITIGGAAPSGTRLRVNSPTSITIDQLPITATTGPIVVTTVAGSATSASNLTVTAAPAPSITSFSPSSGSLGTFVTINGNALALGNANQDVRFNGAAVRSFFTGGTTFLSTNVPPGATTGPITVHTSAGIGTSATAFTVTGPTVAGISPASGRYGSAVTLTGTGFNGATGVFFAPGISAQFAVASDSSITATVPFGASNGPVSVTTPSGGNNSAASFAIEAPSFTSQNPRPNAASLAAIAAGTVSGNPVYVAAGSPSEIWRSTDGVNWSAVYHGPQGLHAATFANGVFVVVGNNGTVLTSTDGSAWTSTNWPDDVTTYRGVAFGGGRFVAVGFGGRLRTSTDGITWSPPRQFANFNTGLNGLASNGSSTAPMFAAVGDSGLIFSSPDGNDWTPRTSGTLHRLRGVAFANGQFIATGENGVLLTSPDAATWTPRTLPNSFTSTLFTAAYGDGKYVTAGFGNLFTSTDAITWTVGSNLSGDIRGLVFANNQFVGAGGTGAIVTSPNAITWTLRTGFTFRNLNDATYGNGRYVVVGNVGFVATSADGQVWTPLEPILPNRTARLRRVVYGKGKFVVVGDGGLTAWSTDGSTWSGNTAIQSYQLNALALGPNGFVAAGTAGTVLTSNEGTSWMMGSLGSGTGSVTINGLEFGAGTFVAVGAGGAIYTSAEGGTWTSRTSGTTETLWSVGFAAGKFIAIGNNSTVLTSTDGISWSSRMLGSPNINLGDVAFGDGYIVAVPRNFTTVGDIFISLDGIAWARRSVGSHRFNIGESTGIAFGNGRFVGVSSGGHISLSDLLPGTLSIATQPVSANISPGATVNFSVAATGSGLTYQWYQGVSGDTSTPATGTGPTTANFTTGPINQLSRFWVRVTNPSGSVDSATATVGSNTASPVITMQPIAASIKVGESATLSVAATSSSPLTYQWRRNGFAIPGATGTSFTLLNASQSDTDLYDVLVSDGFNSTASNAARIGVAPAVYPGNVKLDANFDLGLENDVQGSVLVAAPHNGGLLIGGDFVRVNGVVRRRLARFNADGSLDLNFAPTFNLTVNAIVVQPADNKIIVGGQFTNVNGVARSSLVRLNADGTTDGSFNPGGAGPNGNVSAMVRQPVDGKLYIAGGFSSYNGALMSRLARLQADGTLDTEFNPGTGVTPGAGVVPSLALDTSFSPARLLIGGSFTSYNGESGVNRVARLLPSGARDTSFNVGSGVEIDVGFATVNAIAYDAVHNAVLIGGNFTRYNGTSINRLARLTPTGALDPTFVVGSGTTGASGPNGTVSAIALDPSVSPARVVIAGSFSSYNNNTAINRVARLDHAGTLDTGFSPNPNGNVNALLVESTSIVIGGLFNHLGTTPAARLARVSMSGSLAATPVTSTRAAGNVFRLLPLPGGKVLVAGAFSHVGETPKARLIRLNPNLTLDTSFNPGGAGPNFLVSAAVAQGDGKIVIAGNFNTYNGLTANRVARIHADGTLDASFNVGNGPNSSPNALFALPGGRTLVGGSFGTFAGTGQGSLVRLNPDGSLDSSFNAGSGFAVNAIGVQSTGKIVVGGSFTSIAGQTRNRVARFNADGSLDAFNTGTGATSQVRYLEVLADDRIYIAGDFSNFNDANVGRIARLNGDGSLDDTFAPGGSVNNSISTFLRQEDGRVLLLGQFNNISNIANTALVARLSSAGTLDPSLASFGLNFHALGISPMAALHVLDDGRVLAGSGSFTSNFLPPSQQEKYGLVLFVPGVARQITQQPVSLAVNVGQPATFSVTAAGDTPIRYQWRKFGAPISGATNASYTLASATPADAGSYSVQVTNIAGTLNSNNAALAVNFAPVITLQPQNANVAPNTTAILSVGVEAEPDAMYQWFKGTAAITGANGNALVIPNVLPSDAGAYSVMVSNRLGHVTSGTATLTVANLPVITAPPTPAFVNAGASATLSVSATGTGPLIYQWRKNGVPLPNATNASYTIPSVDAGSTGLYAVGVGDDNGATTSPYVAVGVDSPFLDEGFAPPQFAGLVLPSRMELLSDGSFLVGNTARNPSLWLRRAAPFSRYLPAGARDERFDFTLPTDFNGLTAAVASGGQFYAGVLAARYLLDGDRAALVRFNHDGTVDPAFAPFFYDRAGAGSGEIRGLAIDPNGKVVATGFFRDIAGTGRAGIARFNTDGTLDTTLGATTMGGGNGVWSRAIFDANGNILVGGDFSFFNGTFLPGIARLLPTGANDPSFVPSGFRQNAAIRGILVQSDGRIVLGGRFTVNGVGNIPFIRLHPSGLIDTSFVLTPMPPLANGAIRDLIPLSEGKFAGVSFSVFVRNADGSAVPASEFTPPVLANAVDESPAEAFVIRRKSDGTYLLAGLFSHVNGIPQIGIARLTANGIVQPFPVEPMGGVAFPLTFVRTASGRTLGAFAAGGLNNGNGLIDLLPDGRPAQMPFSPALAAANEVVSVTAAGDDRIVAVVTEPDGSRTVRRILPDGSADPGFVTTTRFSTGPTPDTAVVQPDGKILLMSRVGISNQSIVNGERLRRLNADGTLDTGYAPVLEGAPAPVRGTPLAGETVGPLQSVTRLGIEVLAVDANKRAYVRYTSDGNTVRLSRLNADGSRDTTFPVLTAPASSIGTQNVSVTDPLRPAAGFVQTQILMAGVRREFEAVVVLPGGKVLVGGEFTTVTINGTPVSAPGLVRLNADGTHDATFNSGGSGIGWSFTAPSTEYPAVEAMAQQPDGKLLVAGNFETYNGVAAPGLMRLNADGTRDTSFVAPVTRLARYQAWPEMGLQSDGSVLLSAAYVVPGEIYPRGIVRLLTGLAPASIASFAPATVAAGGTVTIDGAGFTGTTSVRFNGVDAASFTVVSDTQITAVVPALATTGTISISGAGGVATSSAALTVAPGGPLLNASTRGLVGTGELALLSNFTIEGAAPKTVLMRGVGPTLANFGVTGVLADPVLTVHNGTGAMVAANNDWGGSTALSSAFSAAGAFALPATSKDAAMLITLAPGTYTVRVTGAGQTTGQALIEVYDTGDANRLAYLTSRAQAGAASAAVTGFVVGGAAGAPPRAVLIRAVGTPLVPALGALTNPTMSVFASGQGAPFATNDDWGSNANLPAIEAATVAVGGMPLAGLDSALLLSLAPGAYTVQVSGVGGAGGFVLTEVFLVDGYRPAVFEPALLAPLQNRVVNAGASVYFNAPTIGKPGPVSYQWKRNGVNVAGAGGVGPGTLFVLSASATNAGNYSVVMTNSAGSVTSAPATLSIAPPTGFSAAQTVSGNSYNAGGTVTVTNTLTYAGTASSLGWAVNIPPGWSFASDAGSVGNVRPAAGATQTLEWAWSEIPASPVTFAYTLNVPANEHSLRALAASAIVRTSTAVLHTFAATPDPIVLAPAMHHSADSDRDFRISLLELTRVIELYNTRRGTERTGCYQVQAGTEDGFAPDPVREATAPVTLTRYHSADTTVVGPRDGRINLVELTRVIALYNYRSGTVRTGEYHVQAGTEDGFATGP